MMTDDGDTDENIGERVGGSDCRKRAFPDKASRNCGIGHGIGLLEQIPDNDRQ